MIDRIFSKLAGSEHVIDDLLAFAYSAVYRRKLDFIKSPRVRFRNYGQLVINGRLYFGLRSNQPGLDPRGGGNLTIYRGGSVEVNGSVRLARTCQVYVRGRLVIGAGTYINPSTRIIAHSDVSIGEQCAISWDCQIIDDDLHHFVDSKGKVVGPSSGPIHIGNRVWIGTKAIILKNVTIGDNAIVAAGSVVTRSVPNNSLVAGVPAKVVRENVDWDR